MLGCRLAAVPNQTTGADERQHSGILLASSGTHIGWLVQCSKVFMHSWNIVFPDHHVILHRAIELFEVSYTSEMPPGQTCVHIVSVVTALH